MEIVLAFARTNEAIHAEHLLLKAGLAVHVMPLPSVIRAGCGICLRLPQPQFAEASALLRQAEISVENAYARSRPEGRSTYTLYTGGEND